MGLDYNNHIKCFNNCPNVVYNSQKTGGLCHFCFEKEVNNKIVNRKNKRKINQREGHLKRNYNITEFEYEQMFKSQGFSCYICKKGNKGLKKFPVDHCHKTGIIRGILCHHCNKALGLLKDSIESLNRAIEYLQKDKLDKTG